MATVELFKGPEVKLQVAELKLQRFLESIKNEQKKGTTKFTQWREKV